MTTPSEAHLLAFGRITHNYATCEAGIKIILSAILETRLGWALIAFEPYTATSLKNVAKSLSKERLKPQLAEKFCQIVGDWAAHNYIRNIIAHSRWTDGARPGAIKPRNLSIREGRADYFGNEEDEEDYTADELEKTAQKLHLINERLKRFIQESGLRRIIEEKIAEDKADRSVFSGNETKQSPK